MKPTRETTLGPPVMAWLKASGFIDVYQEVPIHYGGSVADIVATSGPQVVIVELKLVMSWELLHQAQSWRGVAHQVWVAVPQGKNTDGRITACRVFADNGIGVLELRDRGIVEAVGRPAFNRTAQTTHVLSRLFEGQKTAVPAGTAKGGAWSVFRETVDRLHKYVLAHPGTTMKEAVAEIQHHYGKDAGARARLLALIDRGIIKGIRTERVGKVLRLYAEPAEGPR